MSLEEALVYFERIARAPVVGQKPTRQKAPMLSNLALIKLLERNGADVPAKTEETEAALEFALVMALVHFEACNALILTPSEQAAGAFFTKLLFGVHGRTGRDIAFYCGKRLVAGHTLSEAKDFGRVLNNSNDILVLDFSTLQRVVRLAGLNADGSEPPHPKVAWWKRPVLSAPSDQQLFRQGLGKLNCVVKVLDGAVSADDEVGVVPILRWVVNHGWTATAGVLDQ
jgi:hypothetical protein